METATTSSQQPLSFNAVRQFVVRPDRYYRVELRDGVLRCTKSGSQFDLAHPGTHSRHVMKTAEAVPEGELAHWSNTSRSAKILSGIGIVALAGVLIAVTAVSGWLVFSLYMLMAFGFVLLMAGLVTPTREQTHTRPHDFAIPLDRLEGATLRNPQKPGQVARLELRPRFEVTVTLTLETPTDLEVVRSRFLPLLGRRGHVA